MGGSLVGVPQNLTNRVGVLNPCTRQMANGAFPIVVKIQAHPTRTRNR